MLINFFFFYRKRLFNYTSIDGHILINLEVFVNNFNLQINNVTTKNIQIINLHKTARKILLEKLDWE